MTNDECWAEGLVVKMFLVVGDMVQQHHLSQRRCMFRLVFEGSYGTHGSVLQVVEKTKQSF